MTILLLASAGVFFLVLRELTGDFKPKGLRPPLEPYVFQGLPGVMCVQVNHYSVTAEFWYDPGGHFEVAPSGPAR